MKTSYEYINYSNRKIQLEILIWNSPFCTNHIGLKYEMTDLYFKDWMDEVPLSEWLHAEFQMDSEIAGSCLN